MNQETPKLNIVPKAEKVFRDKSDKKENLIFKFSPELENDGINKDKASKKLEIFDAATSERIGAIYFNEIGNAFEIKEIAVDEKYRSNEVGVTLYKKLIDLAKNKKIGHIKSDCVVQGGALAIWKKLQEEGYRMKIHSSVKDKYEKFLEIYKEGKYFRELLRVPIGESVFEINNL